MANVLVLTRRDGSTETAHISSPYLAVRFERAFKREPDTAHDTSWIAYLDLHGDPPTDDDELLDWLKQFIGTEIADYQPPDPTGTANGTEQPDSSLPT